MSIDKDDSEAGHAPPDPAAHREARREKTVIDATAVPIEKAASEATESDDEATVAAVEPPNPTQSRARLAPVVAPRSLLPWVGLILASVALLVGLGVGGHVFVTTDGAIVDLRAASAAMQSRVAGLDQKISGLDQKTAAASADAGALAALQQRVAVLEAASKNASANLASLQSDTRKAVSLAEAPPPAPQVDLAPLEQRIADLEARLQPLAAAVAASKADVNANQDIVRKAVFASDAAALVVVAQSLVGELDRGAPFASEVAAAQALGADGDQITALQPLAAKGVATAAALARSFAPLVAPILTGTGQKQAAGILDRLERGAASLVQVRPVGAAAESGTDPAALAARIEGALAQGDVAGAVAARDQLPAAAKDVTADWAIAAKARVAADNAAQALLADAIARLGRSKS